MGYPFKPGDWVSNNSDHIALVKSVYGDEGDVLLDLCLYNRDGDKIGRESPAMGGPRTFEPAVSGKDWHRIKPPKFPVMLKWVPNEKGGSTSRYWLGDKLPPLDWMPKKRAYCGWSRKEAQISSKNDQEKIFRQALETIAAGHNDARQLAKDILSKTFEKTAGESKDKDRAS
jgi:hypothetical protein